MCLLRVLKAFEQSSLIFTLPEDDRCQESSHAADHGMLQQTGEMTGRGSDRQVSVRNDAEWAYIYQLHSFPSCMGHIWLYWRMQIINHCWEYTQENDFQILYNNHQHNSNDPAIKKKKDDVLSHSSVLQ